MRVGVSLPVRELKDDVAAIRDFAQTAEELGFAHLRVPDQVLRPESGHLHEPLTLLSWVAALTSRIELVPSVIVLPERPTALVAKQAAEIDVLSGGRLRLGVGVGGSREEYAVLGQDFHTRGRRCDEQLELLHLLWTQEKVDFEGRWDRIEGAGIDPLPVQRPIPVWIGAGPASREDAIVRRIARYADGWSAIIPPADARAVAERVRTEARAAGRGSAQIGMEGGAAVVDKPAQEWLARISAWREAGASHVCIRTLGGGLGAAAHLATLRATHARLEAEGLVAR